MTAPEEGASFSLAAEPRNCALSFTWLRSQKGCLKGTAFMLPGQQPLLYGDTQKMLSFSIKVGWIFTDLVSEDTRKGTVRYSRNKVRWRQEYCLARNLVKVELTWTSVSAQLANDSEDVLPSGGSACWVCSLGSLVWVVLM